ncbi:MAG: ClbS/DfsB family four-helix bundle protein [Leptotrichiaceae bacterium]|nr:ClbS/DfsB family four-helix bundle protein [Leptotrichiaceae bacterium]
MQEYSDSRELINEINKRAELFIGEFKEINDENKDILLENVDRTPAQMIAYQLGWIGLILSWEERNMKGEKVVTPDENYKWNNLNKLYQSFYEEYKNFSIEDLKKEFNIRIEKIIELIKGYNDKELFEAGGRQWAASTPSNWPVWKWIHINTVAPFKTFRTKIRKWKKIYGLKK